MSDDFITNIGGIAALLVVFIPTRCIESTSTAIDMVCLTKNYPLYGHDDIIKNTIHLSAAGIFILSMGWMSKYKFTRSKNDLNNKLYKLCGNLVFISVGLILMFLILEKLSLTTSNWFFNHYVFLFETTAVIPFGISWLVKGHALDNMKDFGKRLFK